MFVVKDKKNYQFSSLCRVCTRFINFNYGPQAEKDRVRKKEEKERCHRGEQEKCPCWTFKRIDRSFPSEFEKEKNKIVPPHSLPAIVTKNILVLAQRAGFLDPL